MGLLRKTGADLEVRDAEMLRLSELGLSTSDLAERFGVSRSLVCRRLKIAAESRSDSESEPPSEGYGPPVPGWLVLIPAFPIGAFSPTARCGHGPSIREGSLLCCMVCHGSGVDGHPSLRRDPRRDPAPEKRTVVESKTARKTRRQRRSESFPRSAQ